MTATSRNLRALALGTAAALMLASCGVVQEKDAAPRRDVDLADIKDAVPRAEPRSKYGNPPSYEVHGKRYYTMKSSAGFVERGVASWYGTKFHGRRTSSGEIYDMYQMTAAHKNLPLPTYVEVVNLENNRRAVLKVNDRGPFHDNRIIDLSYAAARKLGVVEKGTAFVEVRAINPAGATPPRRRVASAPSPSVPAQATAPVTAAGPAPRPGELYLQIGAFTDRRNAEVFREKVAATLGREVHVAPSSVNGRQLFRVRVGPLPSVERADQVIALLSGIGIDDHHLMVN